MYSEYMKLEALSRDNPVVEGAGAEGTIPGRNFGSRAKVFPPVSGRMGL